MSSSVFYRFKSQKDFTRLSFDSPLGIGVFDLKRDIITREKLGNGEDFDLRISNADSKQEYADDAETVPKGTSIIVQRQPPARGPRKGTAQRYVTGNPIHIQSRQEFSNVTGPTPTPRTATATPVSTGNAEEDAIKAMFAATDNNWAETQDKMALSKPVFRAGGTGKFPPAAVPDRPPPQGYICYRCGLKGHWIQACPTLGDENFENRVRIRRTTGIPRSQLQKVENIDDVDPASVMVNAEGETVMFVPDSKSWESYKEIQEQNKDESLPADHELACAICHKLLKSPHKTPCCSKVCCEDCITGALLESDFVCPLCGTADILLDKLIVDEEMAGKVKAYKESKQGESGTSNSDDNAVAGQKRALEGDDEQGGTSSETGPAAFGQFELPGMPPMPMLPGMPQMPMPGMPMMPGMPPMPMMPGMPPMDPMMFAQMMGMPFPPDMMAMMQQGPPQSQSEGPKFKKARQG
ncbi:DWNN domain-domain-containing protein [Protomyces lactucae-debilis]|uniref:DWNN domain-domain-containing protein n=1 Tax=Protomyces lactucae-debilis TaxID=2754530 RepID=A0A1Y2FNB4_PROLT|nr:DWNN domain-containing protein [Protomyces lactucae-debilis]ORY84215.1 DWNN domain-domain-containing protein [Protomyces lactucae-debilis]